VEEVVDDRPAFNKKGEEIYEYLNSNFKIIIKNFLIK